MWPFFEAPHVFHRPVYASMYPPAQGVILAVGQVLTGVPWIGVWLSVGLMGAAICWMLQGWLPPGWALFAALLLSLRLGTVSYWMNSYWGGAPAAIGGALALGAVAWLRRRPRAIHSVMLGTGLSLLVNSRPFEAVLLGLTIGPAVLRIALPSRGGWSRTATVIVPALAVLALAGATDAYYQWRVTGSPWRLPYQVNRQTYGWPQTFYWQPALPPGTYAQETMYGYYQWERALHDRGRTLRGFALATVGKLKAFWPFFLGPALTPFVLLLPRAVTDRRPRLLAAVCLVMVVALSGYGFFFAHYAAPVVGALFALLVQGMRHVRVWRWRGRPVGRAAVRLNAGVCGAMLLLAAIAHPEVPTEEATLGWRPPSWYMSAPGSPRERVREQLEAQPGPLRRALQDPADSGGQLLHVTHPAEQPVAPVAEHVFGPTAARGDDGNAAGHGLDQDERLALGARRQHESLRAREVRVGVGHEPRQQHVVRDAALDGNARQQRPLRPFAEDDELQGGAGAGERECPHEIREAFVADEPAAPYDEWSDLFRHGRGLPGEPTYPVQRSRIVYGGDTIGVEAKEPRQVVTKRLRDGHDPVRPRIESLGHAQQAGRDRGLGEHQ